jgi:hypothetical protein
MLINAIRGFAAEFGVTVAKGPQKSGQALRAVPGDRPHPGMTAFLGFLAAFFAGEARYNVRRER